MPSHQGGREEEDGLKFEIMLGSCEGERPEKKMQRCERRTRSRHLELNKSHTTTELFAPCWCETSQQFRVEALWCEELCAARLSQSPND